MVEIQKYLRENAQLKKDIQGLDQSLQQIKIQFNELNKSNSEVKKENLILNLNSDALRIQKH